MIHPLIKNLYTLLNEITRLKLGKTFLIGLCGIMRSIAIGSSDSESRCARADNADNFINCRVWRSNKETNLQAEFRLSTLVLQRKAEKRKGLHQLVIGIISFYTLIFTYKKLDINVMFLYRYIFTNDCEKKSVMQCLKKLQENLINGHNYTISILFQFSAFM